MMNRISTLAVSAVVAASFFAPAVLRAQDPAANRLVSVLMVQVKPDMLDEWTDLVKNEVIPALKKAGIPSMNASQTVLGSGGEFVFVTPLDKMATLDLGPALERGLGKEAGQRLSAKLRKCSVSSRSFVSTIVGSLSNPAPQGKELPIRVFSRYRIVGGKNAEYESYVKNEVLPHYKKAGVYTSYSRRGLGSPTAGEVVVVMYAENFAALEGGPPLRRILGEEASAKLFAKAVTLRNVIENVVRRHRPDLSYTAASRTSTE